MRTAWRAIPPQWRDRVLRVGGGFVVVIILAQAIGLQPSIPLLAGAVLAGLAVGYAMDTPTAIDDRSWLAGDLAGTSLWRGSDHATTSLADHLARIEESPLTTLELTAVLHERLRATLEAWVWRTAQVDLRRNTDWARSLLPRDLADFYTAPPDPRALHPDRLADLLTRIENL